MGRKVTLAVSTLNQWALDFDGNLNRIMQSIQKARDAGATFRSGPELEICGYSCEDHFYEGDTLLHSWEVLLELIISPICRDMIIDVGMPVMHKNCTYNCRVVFFNRKILLIRPKMRLCDNGNYRESRWFTEWRKPREVEDYYLPRIISTYTGQSVVAFGDAVIATRDTCIGYEICEELWNPASSHIRMCQDGVELIVNGSGSYMELRKAYITVDLIKSATFKAGGCYLFSNLRGCDGQRVFFNGCSCIAVNGEIVKRSRQFAVEEVELTVATVDLEDIRTYRNHIRSLAHMSGGSASYPRITVDFGLSDMSSWNLSLMASRPIEWVHHTPEEEITMGPACWLWDYLRRSGQGGFFLPLSGGVDSASTACIVYSMCNLVTDSCNKGDPTTIAEVRKIVSDAEYIPKDPKELCSRLFVTSYLATENSSKLTKDLAASLASQIGSYHLDVNICDAVVALLTIFARATNRTPRFSAHGGSARESLAMQNIQARMRMVTSYLFAQLILWTRNRPGGLLVLGSSNVDEALRGYMTKYDCSSADINPIGGISKTDLKAFLRFARQRFDLPVLDQILQQTPTAELEPLENGVCTQSDEADMGMTYSELSIFGTLRKQNACGPFSMFCKLLSMWHHSHTPAEVADKVKHFFRCYAIHRHKMTVLTPSYHAESYSPDDNRFDHRPFLYNVKWKWQFKAIDDHLQQLVSGSSLKEPEEVVKIPPKTLPKPGSSDRSKQTGVVV
ncbi:glutamine-dependent NAD(+) synthetase [Nilaparvata lugens]|uniref:glutamine-dependent NAD(+) synthetase n=1 Tax=Nilaparvata lugens TaxID=108931 RepID=UPI00193DE6DB|nr:glutamine-dependent NAD(+) synthetase [Nilaparvata lugens]XP_039281306.1 glutamine-dependent NAD(+) synthetase [Nilaparvata lugens]XP_039281307.1 glutamine-dependent NAD(+) synthetase [Nilaparvata lugens]